MDSKSCHSFSATCVKSGALALTCQRSPGRSFPSSFRFPIVNERDRQERGLLVLIYPRGSLGITINSQLLAYSTGPYRHYQFVPIRGPGLCLLQGFSGRTGQTRPALGLTTFWFWSPSSFSNKYAVKTFSFHSFLLFYLSIKIFVTGVIFGNKGMYNYFRLCTHFLSGYPYNIYWEVIGIVTEAFPAWPT